MRTIFAEYNPQRNSIDVYTSAGNMLRIDCGEAEKNLTTTPGYLLLILDIHAANISIYFVTLVPPNTSDIGIFSSIASIFFTSSGVNKISDAPAFSSKRSSFLVPGIGTRYGFFICRGTIRMVHSHTSKSYC